MAATLLSDEDQSPGDQSRVGLSVPVQDIGDAAVVQRYLRKYADRTPDFADLSRMALT